MTVVSPKLHPNSKKQGGVGGGTRRRFASGMPRGWRNRARRAGISNRRINRISRIAQRGGMQGVRRRTNFGSNRYRRRVGGSLSSGYWGRRRRRLRSRY